MKVLQQEEMRTTNFFTEDETLQKNIRNDVR